MFSAARIKVSLVLKYDTRNTKRLGENGYSWIWNAVLLTDHLCWGLQTPCASWVTLCSLLTYFLTYLLYLPTYLLIHLFSPWSRVLLEKLTGFQLLKKFPAFYGTRRFITAFTSTRHLSLSWASSIQSISPHPTSWRSILILSSHLHLGLPSGYFPQVSPPKPCIHLSTPPYAPHAPPISFFSILPPAQYWVRSTDH